jgi:hypothetical protein
MDIPKTKPQDYYKEKTMEGLLRVTGLDKRKVEMPVDALFEEIYGSRINDKYKFTNGEKINLCCLALRRMRYDKALLWAENIKLRKENATMREREYKLL